MSDPQTSDKAEIRRGDAGALALSGTVTLNTVTRLRAAGDPLLDAALSEKRTVTVDLAEVSRVDSAALSLVLHWMRRARRANGTISLTNVPSQFRAIARTSRMDELLEG